MKLRFFRSSLILVLGIVLGILGMFASEYPASAQQKIAPSGWVESEPKNAPPNAVSGGSGTKTPLQGGIQHSDSLPSLPGNLQTGAIYDEKSIARTADDAGWYEIPDWLAGKWLREQETVLSTYFFDTGITQNEPRTIAERELAEFGFQRDKLGHVWHRRLADKGVSDVGSYVAIAFVQTQEPLQVSNDMVTIRDVFIELQVNKETHVIISSSQAESITRYRPMKDGVIKTNMSVKVFNEDGSPKTVQKNTAYDQRVEAFKSTDAHKGEDLRKNFAEFLRGTGRDALVP